MINTTNYAGPAHRRLALTVDDLPVVPGPRDRTERAKIFSGILRTLECFDLRTIGFVVGSYVLADDAPLLDEFVGNGHLVGNHSFSYKPLNDLTVDEFERDLLRCEDVLARWLRRPMYFRYPLLRTGNDPARKVGFLDVLARHGYTPVWATIDNDDWRFSLEYCDALDSRDDAPKNEVAARCLRHLLAASDFFHLLGLAMWPDSMMHVLLVHANELNLHWLHAALSTLRDFGWEFVDPKYALEDPIYSFPDTRIGLTGVSWLYQLGVDPGIRVVSEEGERAE